jgi:hypothetical protein
MLEKLMKTVQLQYNSNSDKQINQNFNEIIDL